MNTYDRVSEQILKEKHRIDIVIRQNQELREKCLKALRICKAEIDRAFGSMI